MMKLFLPALFLSLISMGVIASPTSGDLVCGPVALKRDGGAEFKRKDPTLLNIHIDDSMNQFSTQKEFAAADFKDANFEGKLVVRATGQRLDDSYPDALKNKFVLTLNYVHYSLNAEGKKIGHASGYTQGQVFEPLTGNADGDDVILKGAGATCMFFPEGTLQKN